MEEETITLDNRNVMSFINISYINETQARELGIPYPPEKGWKESLIGRKINKSNFDYLCRIRGIPPKRRKLILRPDQEVMNLF